MNRNSASYTFIFIVIICVIFGIGISLVHYATLNTLAKNEVLNRNRVICNAFLIPVKGDSPQAFQQAIDNNILTKRISYNGTGFQAYFRKDIESPNVGFIFSGMGFWDRITGIIVLTSDLNKVINIQFLDQKETPGLGARIEEDWFTDQFKGLQIDWKGSPNRRVIIGNSSVPDARNRVDAVTGASQTSLALDKILNDELNRFRLVYLNYRGKEE